MAFIYQNVFTSPANRPCIRHWVHPGVLVGGNLNGLRIKAFAVTLVIDGNPKKIQQKREKQLTAGETIEPVDNEVDSVMKAIGKAVNVKNTNRLDMVRSSLKRSVIEDHGVLSYEEVESIVRNALAEAVIGS